MITEYPGYALIAKYHLRIIKGDGNARLNVSRA